MACPPPPPPTPPPPAPTPPPAPGPGPPPTPPSSTDLWSFLRGYSLLTNLTSLCGLSQRCVGTLSSSSLTTIFAPTDSAFNKLSVETRAALWKTGNSGLRDHFLLRHLVFGDILSTALKPAQDLQTLDGSSVHVTRTSTSAGDVITVEEQATVSRKDMVAANGVVDTIDTCIPAAGPRPTPQPAQPTPAVPTPGGPSLFVCKNATCVAAPAGISKADCQLACK